jgi:hypothetical protein
MKRRSEGTIDLTKIHFFHSFELEELAKKLLDKNYLQSGIIYKEHLMNSGFSWLKN